jgi:hypothetical protein
MFISIEYKMVKIGIENIGNIKLEVLSEERTFDGELPLHSAVRQKYEDKEYHNKPKSSEEASEKGESHFNGLMSSFTCLSVSNSGGEVVVFGDIAPTRYLIGQAMRDYVAEIEQPSSDYIRELSPDMANVSLIAPVRHKGGYFILSQIKGKALGSGQIHAGIVAGNIDAKYLSYEDPMTATLKNECSEEIGLDLNSLDSTSFCFMVDERITGQINFASIANGIDMSQVLGSYEIITKNKLMDGGKLEVKALASLPVAGLALVPLEDGSNGIKDIECYFPVLNKGLESRIEDRNVRPYTEAVLNYLHKPENVKFLLEKAGF